MPFKSDPLQTVTNNGTVAAVSNTSDAKAGQQAAKKKKKTGKKLMDTSVLGFVASADPNRLNVGEIDSHMWCCGNWQNCRGDIHVVVHEQLFPSGGDTTLSW